MILKWKLILNYFSDEEKSQSKTESSSTTVSNNNKRPQPLPRRIIRSTPLEDTGALQDTTKLIQLNVCAPTTVPQSSQPAVDRASTSVTLSASSSDEVVLLTETVEQTQTVMKKASPAPTSTATKTTVAKTAVSPPTSRPRTVQTITQRTTAPPPPQLKKPSVDVASNSTTSNGIVKSSTLTTAIKKVTSSTSSTSSVQKSLVKKLKSMQPPTGLTDSALNKGNLSIFLSITFGVFKIIWINLLGVYDSHYITCMMVFFLFFKLMIACKSQNSKMRIYWRQNVF